MVSDLPVLVTIDTPPCSSDRPKAECLGTTIGLRPISRKTMLSAATTIFVRRHAAIATTNVSVISKSQNDLGWKAGNEAKRARTAAAYVTGKRFGCANKVSVVDTLNRASTTNLAHRRTRLDRTAPLS